MLTQNAFAEHKQDYTVMKKVSVLDEIYHSETNTFIEGGTINVMFTPVADEASIQTYGEQVNNMMQAIVYDETDIDAHDQITIDGNTYEFVSIKKYPSFRLVQVRLISDTESEPEPEPEPSNLLGETELGELVIGG